MGVNHYGVGEYRFFLGVEIERLLDITIVYR